MNGLCPSVCTQLAFRLIHSGYFSHVTSLAEVKEQVLKYIPVMARPMVLYKEYHPIRWTGVHVDNKVSTKHTKKCLLLIPTYQRIEITLAEAWSFGNTNEIKF